MKKCKDKQGNDIEDLFNYYVSEHMGTMTIYYGERISVCELSDCANLTDRDCEELMLETLNDLGFEVERWN